MIESVVLHERYMEVRRRVAEAGVRAGRRPEEVLIVAVTKYAEPEQVRELISLGQRDFGENYVQQLVMRASMVQEHLDRQRVLGAAVRAPSVPAPGAGGGAGGASFVRWHMIGHLQRNKARKAVEFCRLIQTVDSLRLAEELQQIGERREEPIEVLVQVNCSGEERKSGCPQPAARHLVEQIDSMVQLRVRGLMTMAPEGAEDPRGCFERCRDNFEDIRRVGAAGPGFNILSMGMSHDFEAAIEEGATMVRVGTAIFGERRPAAGTETVP